MILNYKKGKHDFYFIYINKIDEDHSDYGEIYLSEVITGFTTNEKMMALYKTFYSSILGKCKYVETFAKNVEYSEFENAVKRTFGVELDERYYIEFEPIDLLNTGVFYTGMLSEDIWEYDAQMGFLEDTLYQTYFEAGALMKLNYLLPIDDVKIIYNLIMKLVNFYVPLLGVSEWFENEDVSDTIKINLTKYFDLPAPLESYQFFDIFCSGYRVLMYLDDQINLTGVYPQDE